MTQQNDAAADGNIYWSSRLTFILAATGSAVGLGNIWGFPYKAGESGGGAFVLVYLVCVLAIGLPIMMSEILVGRHTRKNPIQAMEMIARESGHSPRWRVVGLMGVCAGFLILSFYSVIGGWSLAYVFRALDGSFSGMTAESTASMFADLVGDAERSMAWHTLFMVTVTVIVAKGVHAGLEAIIKWLMPILFLLLFVLVGIASLMGDFKAAVEYLFVPDFSAFTSDVVVSAMGQAFFSLSLGLGAIMMYGAYLPNNASIGKTSLAIVGADTAVALISGLAIFPLVFTIPELQPTEGPSLVFKVLPQIFGQIDSGGFVAVMFFVLLVIAAVTSAVSLMEPVVSWMVTQKGMDRDRAAHVAGFAIWFLGLGTVLSFSSWSDETLTIAPRIGDRIFVLVDDKNFFEILEFLTFSLMLPLGGVLIAYFVGFVASMRLTRKELSDSPRAVYATWLFLVRNVAPILGLIILLNMLGVLDSIFLWLGLG
ncbi:MAG: sodium-dependent transporter [Pseudomonadota bacterium]